MFVYKYKQYVYIYILFVHLYMNTLLWNTHINLRIVTMDLYIIHGLILCLVPTLKKGQNLFDILVSSLQLYTFIIV